MTPRCMRSWEVEAARDGRLVGEAREAFEVHLEQCQKCATDAHYIAALATGLQTIAVHEPDDVALRRLRHQVLAAVDATHVTRSTFLLPSRRVAVVASLVAAAAAVLVVARGLGGGMAPIVVPAVTVAAATTVDVVPANGARFTRSTDASFERVDLAEGALHLAINRVAGGRRVVVKVPDGEIEDLGTVFDVTVTAGRTERIVVENGEVRASLAGAPPFTVGAGTSWLRPVAPADVEAKAPVGARPAVRPPPGPAAPRASSAASDGEDAAYLSVVRLVREGRQDEARTAAQGYLRSFPNGFRRDEMSRVAKDRAE